MSTLSIDITLQSILYSDQLSQTYAKGRADYRIVSEKRFITEDLFAHLKSNFADIQLAPVLEGKIMEGKEKWKIFGIDFFSEMQIRPSLMNDLSSMTNSNWGLDLLRYNNAVLILFKDDKAKLSFTRMSQRNKPFLSSLKIIETISLENSLLQNFYAAGTDTGKTAQNSLLMDLATAQKFTGHYGKLSYIDIEIDKSNGVNHVKSTELAIKKLLSKKRWSHLKIINLSESTEENKQFSSSFRLNLRALSFLMFLVGIFLIANTIYLFSLKRYSLFSLYLCLGVSQSQIFWIFFTEILILAFIGGALGSAAGMLSAKALLDSVLQVFQDHYFKLNVANIVYDAQILGRNYFLGMAAALLASVFPYWKISKVPPIQLMTKKNLRINNSYLWKISALGAILLALGWLTSFSQTQIFNSPIHVFLGFFFQILGYLCFVPLVAWAGLKVMRLLKKTGVWWKLSTSLLMNHLGHIFILLTALVMLFSTALTMEIFVTSFRNHFIHWFKTSLDADLFFRLEGRNSQFHFAKLKKIWMQDNEITHLKTMGVRMVDTQAGRLELRITETHKGENTSKPQVWKTTNKDSLMQKMKNTQSILISETLYHKQKWKEGDRIKLNTDHDGFQEFRILGVYRDFSSEKGSLLVYKEQARKFWQEPKEMRVALGLSKSEYTDLYIKKIEDYFSKASFLRIYSKQFLFETSLSIFDRTFQISDILKSLAFLVAFIGSLSAFLLLGNFQKMTFSYLRHIGCTRGEIFYIHFLQFFKIGCISGLASLCLGLWMSWYLMQVVNPQTFGWEVNWNFGWELFLKFLGGVFLSISLSSFISLFLLRDKSLAALENE